MFRVAGHYVYWKELMPIHFIEMDENRLFAGVFPLTEETSSTLFLDGIVYPAPEDFDETTIDSLDTLIQSGISRQLEIGCRIKVCRIPSL